MHRRDPGSATRLSPWIRAKLSKSWVYQIPRSSKLPLIFPPIQGPTDDPTLANLLKTLPQAQSPAVVSGGGALGSINQAAQGSSTFQPSTPALPDSPFQPQDTQPVPSVLGTVGAPSRSSLALNSANGDVQAAQDRISADTPKPYDWHAHGALGNIGHVAGRIGNIVGDVLDPAATALIPHSDLWNQGRLAADQGQLYKAQINQQAAQKESDTVDDNQATRDERTAAANKPSLIETDNGYAYLDPTTQKVTPVFSQDGKQLQPFQKDITKTPQEQAYASLVAGGMSPAAALAAVQNPKNEIKQIEIGGKPHQVMFDDKGNQIKDLGETGEKPPTVNVNAGASTLMIPDGQGGYTATRVLPGQHVAPGAVTTSGLNSENVPTSSTRTMVESVPGVLDLAEKTKKLIQQQQANLGPGSSRERAFMQGVVGQSDPAFSALRTEAGLLITKLMRMHVGAKGGQGMMEHFQEMLDIKTQSPENLLANIEAIEGYANEVGKTGNQGSGQISAAANGAGAPPAGAKVRDYSQLGAK